MIRAPDHSLTGVVLAGGMNTRFADTNKVFARLDGLPLIDRLCRCLSKFSSSLILVTNNPRAYADRDLHIVTDLFSARSALSGIHAGLFHAATPYIFICTCYMPFIKKELIELLAGEASSGADIVVPVTDHGYEPLCAVYAQKCLPAIEHQLTRGKLQIRRLFRKQRVKEVSTKRIRTIDPFFESFIKIHTPEELKIAERRLNRR
jgi:molybdopterin-guanine dinucleotide biosynthesis protein A